MPRADPPVEVDRALLQRLPLPTPDDDTDKTARGSVLVVGGSTETPGGLLLAGEAALRVGAGRIQLATVASAAVPIALAMPESRTIALPEHADGTLDAANPRTAERLERSLARVDVVLLGTGCTGDDGWEALVRSAIGLGSAALVLDAGALGALPVDGDVAVELQRRAVVMPNPSEMARLLDRDEDTVAPDDIPHALDEAVERLQMVVALRGADTWIGAPSGQRFVARLGHPGLATAGSGDVLAGALAGLVARGTDPVRATVWAVYAHAVAGRELTALHSGIGLLARELPGCLPHVIGDVGSAGD